MNFKNPRANIRSKKDFIIGYSIITIITIIIFALLIYFNVFKRSQQNMHDSLATGFGYYSDPIPGPCTTTSGDCGEAGTQKITKHCVVHPVTGKGCLLPDGTMSYDSLVETIGCRKQCIGSAFDVSDGVDVKFLQDSDNTLHPIVLGSGGNHLVNNFGIDYTDEFVDSFDAVNNIYKIKKCFNDDEYQVYSTTKYTCNTGDSDKASNNCIFTCGVDDVGALRLKISNNVGLGIKVPNYPTSNGRYICYDKFGNNQVETFNTGKIPNDFIYPETCYEHYYETGNDTTIKKIDKVNDKQKFFSIDQVVNKYDILYDYNFFHPLTIGSQETMAEKIVNTDSKFVIGSNITPYIYLDMGTDYSSPAYLNVMTNPIKVITKNATPNGDNYSLANNNTVAIDIEFFITNGPLSSSYFYENGQLIIRYDSAVITPTATSYIYYRIDSNNVENFSTIAGVESVDISNSVFKITGPDLGKNGYKYNIKYWLLDSDRITSQIEIPLAVSGISVANRLENNKYFISDLIIPYDNFFDGVSNVKKLYPSTYINNSADPPNDIFYVYSKINKAFYYPVTLKPRNDATKFTLPDYGGDNNIFYLLTGGMDKTIYPPDEGLSYKSFDDLNGYIEISPVVNNYGTSIYIKQIIPLSTNTNNYISQDFFIYDGGFNKYNLFSNNTPMQKINGSVIQKAGSFLDDIDSKTFDRSLPYVDKIKLYNDIMVVKDFNFVNEYGTSFNFIISPLKAVVQVADYSVFRSPHVLNSEGEVTQQNICFDQFNRPIQPGTKVQIQPGEEIVFYKQTVINSNQYKCGFYGASGGFYVDQPRSKQSPVLGTSAIVVKDYLRYYNYLDYLTPGYELDKLYCFQKNKGDPQPETTVYCREPYITSEFRDINNTYNSTEELYQIYTENNLYLSKVPNNINDPDLASNWKSINKQSDNEYIYLNEAVYSERNNYIFVYTSTESGMLGEELSKLGVYYLYNKAIPIFDTRNPGNLTPSLDFYTQSKYYQNNWVGKDGLTGDPYAKQALQACNTGGFDNFIYQLGVSTLSNNENITTISHGSSLYDLELSLGTLNNFGTSDYINPDFNLFNSILISDGISVFNFKESSGTNEMYAGVSIFTGVSLTGVAKDDLVFIAYDNTIELLSQFSASLICNTTGSGCENFNYSFEICKVLDFKSASNNSTVTVKRNLLNYPLANIFYGSGITKYVAYLLDPNINLDLIFPITKVISNTLFFKFSAYFENEPIINNILKNCQSRTALSARIIKGNIVIPNSQIEPETNLFLMSSPEINKVSSYLDLMLKLDVSTDFYVYYINEFRSDNFLNNGSDPIFEEGDIITLTFPSGVTYNLPITNKKVTYGLSLFDYYSATNINITELNNTETLYGVSYIDSTNSLPEYFSPIEQTKNPYLNDLIKVSYNSVLSDIGPSNYTTQYYQNVDSSMGYIYYLNTFPTMFSRQINLDKASSMTKMTLNSTRLYSNINNPNSYITIDNIISNEKPYGPTYLTDLVSSNDLNFEGYGTIIDFNYSGNFLHPNFFYTGMILKSKSGFVFSVGSEIGNFKFNTLIRKSNNIPENYNYNNSYKENATVYYKNEKKLLYSNTNNIVSKFNSTGKAGYDQPYYIIDNGIYTYPLYLDSNPSRVSIPYPVNNFYKLWYDAGLSINTTVKPSTNIYKEFSYSGISIKSTWKQVPEGIFPIDNVSDFITNNFYEEGSIVEYEDNIWISQSDNYNEQPFVGSSLWSIYDNYSELFNKSGYFYNINTGVSTVGVSLNNPIKRDINNYPISVIDYESNKKYSLFTEAKDIVNYNDALNGSSFLTVYNSLQTDFLGKILLFKKNGSVISLASSPTSENEIDTYGFLKQMPVYKKGDILSQYIYNIALPSSEYMGKPFCEGNVPYNSSETVSNYEFTNSISFLTIPIDIEYQDYPFVVYDGTSIYDMPPGAVFAAGYFNDGSNQVSFSTGMSPINTIIKGIDGSFRNQTVNFKNSYYGPMQYVNTSDLDSNQYAQDIFDIYTGKITVLDSAGNGNTYDASFDENSDNIYYLPIYGTTEDPRILVNPVNNLTTYKNNTCFPIYETITNTYVGSGILRLYEKTAGEILPFRIFLVDINEDVMKTFKDPLYAILIEDSINYINIVKGKSKLTFGAGFPKTDNVYGFDFNFTGRPPLDILSLGIVFDDDGTMVPFNKIFIDTTGLTVGEKIYFIPRNTNSLKVKMYGFFENEYLSPIIYQSEKLIENTNGTKIPCAIFSPFSNNLLNPGGSIQVIDNNNVKVVVTDYSKESYSDVIDLGVSDNGTSLKLYASHYKYPIFNKDTGVLNTGNVPITAIAKYNGDLPIGIIGNNSVTKFTSTEFYINDYITLGGISDVIPMDDNYDDLTQYYRETKGAINYNTSSLLNCSIYQEERSYDYPDGLIINASIENKSLFNITGGINNTVYQTKNVADIIFNTNTEISQSAPSNSNNPIYIGISGGDKFAGSLVGDKYLLSSSSGILAKYYFNNVGVSSDTYHNLKIIQNFNKYVVRGINLVVYKNDIFEPMNDVTLYLGVSDPDKGLMQFTNGISTLTFKDF